MTAATHAQANLRAIGLEQGLAWATVFLLFVGEIRIPVGGSQLYFPVSLAPAGALCLLRLGTRSLLVPFGAIALAIVLLAGSISAAASEYVGLRRSLAAAFPVGAALLAACALAGVPDLSKVLRSAVLWGGTLLALWIALLSFKAVTSGLPFYEAKLLIETPLGRSNYLTAFLLFYVGIAWRRAPALATIGALAILAAISRGGMLVLLVFVLLTWANRRGLAGIAASVLIAVSIGGAAVLAFADLGVEAAAGDLVSGLASPASAGNRVVLWQASRSLLAESPVLGVGPNGFRSMIEGRPELEDVWGPHNAVLTLWLNYGLAGLCAYCVYLGCLLRALGGARRTPRDADQAFVAVLALLFFSLFEPLIGSASFEVLLAVAYAGGLAQRSHQGDYRRT